MTPHEALSVLEAAGLLRCTASNGEHVEYQIRPEAAPLFEIKPPVKAAPTAANRPSWAFQPSPYPMNRPLAPVRIK